MVQVNQHMIGAAITGMPNPCCAGQGVIPSGMTQTAYLVDSAQMMARMLDMSILGAEFVGKSFGTDYESPRGRPPTNRLH